MDTIFSPYFESFCHWIQYGAYIAIQNPDVTGRMHEAGLISVSPGVTPGVTSTYARFCIKYWR